MSPSNDVDVPSDRDVKSLRKKAQEAHLEWVKNVEANSRSVATLDSVLHKAYIDATVSDIRQSEEMALMEQTISRQPQWFDMARTHRLDRRYFAHNVDFMVDAAHRFTQRSVVRSYAEFAHQEFRIPRNFKTNLEAVAFLQSELKTFLRKKHPGATSAQRPRFAKPEDAIEIFFEARIAVTVDGERGRSNALLLFYDYDRKIYTQDQSMAALWTTTLFGTASAQNVKTFMETLFSSLYRIPVLAPLPRYKIAVGNGIFNTLTGHLEPYSPRELVVNRIETDYVPDAVEPQFAQGMTFEKLVKDLADNNPDRVELILQMTKSIILGYSPTAALFIMLGSGGDGKSVFMSLVSNIIGQSNTGSLNFTDMNDESKILEAISSRLILGMDNNKNVVINNTAFIKSAASRESVSLFRKFMSAAAVKVEGTVVQLCNDLPMFRETGSSMRRRLVAISCENSHYERGDQIDGLSEWVKNPRWHEYILKYLLELPYYTDYNDVDRGIIHASLDGEDVIGLFFQDMDQQGVFDQPDRAKIPLSLLYGMYQDWFAQKYPGSRVHTSRTFDTEARSWLRDYGFVRPAGNPTVKVDILADTNYAPFASVFGDFIDGKVAQEVLEKNHATYYYEKGRARKPEGQIGGSRRFPKVCDALRYFGVWEDVMADVEQHPAAYTDIADRLKLEYVVESLVVQQDIVDLETVLASDDLMSMGGADFLSASFADFAGLNSPSRPLEARVDAESEAVETERHCTKKMFATVHWDSATHDTCDMLREVLSSLDEQDPLTGQAIEGLRSRLAHESRHALTQMDLADIAHDHPSAKLAGIIRILEDHV